MAVAREPTRLEPTTREPTTREPAGPEPVVELEVADECPGIAAEALPGVFDRFYRADPAHSGEGSGLGLAIVAAVAEAHAGTVGLTGAEGRGTRVTVRLPPCPADR